MGVVLYPPITAHLEHDEVRGAVGDRPEPEGGLGGGGVGEAGVLDQSETSIVVDILISTNHSPPGPRIG